MPPWPCGELDQALISLLASAVPLAPAQPVWWLRLSDAAVNLAAVLLLAVMVLRLGDVLLDSDADEARTSRRRSHQLASRWALVFALLVPLQVIGYAWLWADSDSQLNRVINQGESGVAALRSRIQASRSEAELDSLLAGANPGPLPPRQGGSLVERKQQPPRSTRRDAAHLPARHPARVIRGGDRECLSVHARAQRRSGATVALARPGIEAVLPGGFHAQACYHCSQAAEKALKAMLQALAVASAVMDFADQQLGDLAGPQTT
ncbi:MAG: hypothetical protein ACK535_03430 [Cyanobacteriota bacterium]